MPEGPEVRRVYEDLRKEIGESRVTQLQVFSGRFLKKRPIGLDQVILPSRVIDGGVRGKFMWLEFETGATMWITLGMSGYWSEESGTHSHFGIGIENSRALYFVDQRRFGTIKFSHDRAELDKKIKSLGRDPLNDADFTPIEFNQRINKYPNKTITEVLMDQRVCAGIGNYIKCEVLYRSGISPHRLVKDIDPVESTVLFGWIKKIMQTSYDQGGASIRNYQRVGGGLGEFVFEFEVYAQPLDSKGNTVIREETLDGRTTHWVPEVQR
jgi:formamidopyrimidine-DNA glycosylase